MKKIALIIAVCSLATVRGMDSAPVIRTRQSHIEDCIKNGNIKDLQDNFDQLEFGIKDEDYGDIKKEHLLNLDFSKFNDALKEREKSITFLRSMQCCSYTAGTLGTIWFFSTNALPDIVKGCGGIATFAIGWFCALKLQDKVTADKKKTHELNTIIYNLRILKNTVCPTPVESQTYELDDRGNKIAFLNPANTTSHKKKS